MYTRLGRYEEGLEVDMRLVAHAPEDLLLTASSRVRSPSSLRRTDPALDALEHAADLGYDDIKFLASDEDLSSLREHPRFMALVGPRDQSVEPSSVNGAGRGGPCLTIVVSTGLRAWCSKQRIIRAAANQRRQMDAVVSRSSRLPVAVEGASLFVARSSDWCAIARFLGLLGRPAISTGTSLKSPICIRARA